MSHQNGDFTREIEFPSDFSDINGDSDLKSLAKERAIKKLKEQLLKEPVGEVKTVFGEDENEERGNWTGRFDFFLSCLGYAVGLGNVWRFPYLCYKNGGGAFLVPYTLFLLFCGIPIFLIDLSLGQFTSQGPVTCWEFAPIFKGIGYGMCFVSGIVSIYYNMIIAYAIYYFILSIRSSLLWSYCGNEWNSINCRHNVKFGSCNETLYIKNATTGACFDNNTKLLVEIWNKTLFSKYGAQYLTPEEEYFKFEFLNESGDINNMGLPQWKLVLCLFGAWVIAFLCLIKGIKSSGKVVYFTALFPYVILLILFFRGIILPGAGKGIEFYIVPKWDKLRDAQVWKDAASQIFFSLSASWGGLMSLASYNRFHNNVIRDTFVVCFANCGTSVFAGFVIFSYIGFLAQSLGVEVPDVTKEQFGLAFVIYPQALTQMPISPLWSVLFFFMLILLGLDSQFAMIETVTTSLNDKISSLRKHKVLVIGVMSVVMFGLGIPMTCRGGIYLLTVVDSYGGGWNILFIGFVECIAIGWVYGPKVLGKYHGFSEDIALILGRQIWPTWRFMWQFISPCMILFIIIFNFAKYSRTTYTDTGMEYPVWADVLGWFIAVTPVLLVVGTALHQVCKKGKHSSALSLRQRFKKAVNPTKKWGPSLPKHRYLMVDNLKKNGGLDEFYLDVANDIKYTDVFKTDEPLPIYKTDYLDKSGFCDPSVVKNEVAFSNIGFEKDDNCHNNTFITSF